MPFFFKGDDWLPFGKDRARGKASVFLESKDGLKEDHDLLLEVRGMERAELLPLQAVCTERERETAPKWEAKARLWSTRLQPPTLVVL